MICLRPNATAVTCFAGRPRASASPHGSLKPRCRSRCAMENANKVLEPASRITGNNPKHLRQRSATALSNGARTEFRYRIFNTTLIVARSSFAVACSSASIHFRSPHWRLVRLCRHYARDSYIDGRFSLANSISFNLSPGRVPIKAISISRPGSSPESRIMRSARSTILMGWPILST